MAPETQTHSRSHRCCRREEPPSGGHRREDQPGCDGRIATYHRVVPVLLLPSGDVVVRVLAEPGDRCCECGAHLPPHSGIRSPRTGNVELRDAPEEDLVLGGAQVGETADGVDDGAVHQERGNRRAPYRAGRCHPLGRHVRDRRALLEVGRRRDLVVPVHHLSLGVVQVGTPQPLQPRRLQGEPGVGDRDPVVTARLDSHVPPAARRRRPRLDHREAVVVPQVVPQHIDGAVHGTAVYDHDLIGSR